MRLLHPLLVPEPLAFQHLLIEERLDADAPRFRAEMPTQGVRPGKSPTATPLATALEITFAYKLLLAGM